MSIESVKGEFRLRNISDEAAGVVFEHLKKFGKNTFISFDSKTEHTAIFKHERHESRERFAYYIVETANEAVVFIPGDVATIVVNKKLPKEALKVEKTDEAPKAASQPKAAPAAKVEETSVAAKAAMYVAGAVGIGALGYLAWKRWGSN